MPSSLFEGRGIVGVAVSRSGQAVGISDVFVLASDPDVA
ncbi:hypothetical protein HEB29_000094 [Streptomyces fulvorobeus]|uniref:Uncharacterized protein n=1 Tax=Streptomyces fulvorobeus TaxID=284028 RepID=A0A7Y9H710_9ACTN|nr:hypothetical protein [Streptomyces fulvorobeus]